MILTCVDGPLITVIENTTGMITLRTILTYFFTFGQSSLELLFQQATVTRIDLKLSRPMFDPRLLLLRFVAKSMVAYGEYHSFTCDINLPLWWMLELRTSGLIRSDVSWQLIGPIFKGHEYKMGPIGFPEMLVRNSQYSLPNSPEDRSSRHSINAAYSYLTQLSPTIWKRNK
jgi:hypothetical protein